MGRVSKVVDRDEAIRLLRGGMTLQGMVDYYLEEYGISTTRSMWSRFYRDNVESGGKIKFKYDLLPWQAELGVRGERLRQGLQSLGRELSGDSMSENAIRLSGQLRRRLLSEDSVVDYDPLENCFITVPRRVGIDQGWVRDPFILDDGRWEHPGELVRSGAIARYIESGGMSLVDMERPLAPGEKRRVPLNLNHVKLV